MSRERILASSPDAFRVESQDVDQCRVVVSYGFNYDMDGDGVSEDIAVREESYFELPNPKGQMDVSLPFVRHSTVTLNVTNGVKIFGLFGDTATTKARFKDTHYFTMNEFLNSMNGVCPSPTFTGLYVERSAQDQNQLWWGARNYTLVDYKTDNDVYFFRDVHLKAT